MTTNRLATTTQRTGFMSGMRALEWAAIAKSKNLPDVAAKWEEAHRYGWDDEHYCPIKAAALADAWKRP
jgi:hypothetical protein